MRLVDADALEVVGTVIPSGIDEKSYVMGMEYILNKIDSMPTIEERKTGKWRYSRNISSISYSDMMITCDQCGYTKERSHGDVFNFCPSCGARMGGNT